MRTRKPRKGDIVRVNVTEEFFGRVRIVYPATRFAMVHVSDSDERGISWDNITIISRGEF